MPNQTTKIHQGDKMKKLGSTLLLLSAFCFITACDYSDENPQSTVGSAAKALKSDDTQKFLSLLTGPARAEYQNPAAVEALQQHIDQFRKLTVASETLINENIVSNNKTFRTYALEVTDSKGRHALDVQVKCQLNYGRYADAFENLLRVRLLRDRPGRPPAEDSDAVSSGGSSGSSNDSSSGGSSSNDDRPERPPRPERPERPERPDRPHHPVPDMEPEERPERPDRPHHPVPDWEPEERPTHPGRPPRPPRPPRPDDRPDDEPTVPSEPSLSWHQACRIQSIKK